MHPLLLSAVMLGGAALIVAVIAFKEIFNHRALASRIGMPARNTVLKDLGSRTLGRWKWQIDSEIPVLLDQMGWRKPARRALFFGLQLGFPLLMLLAAIMQFAFGEKSGTAIVLFFLAGLVFLVPKRVLAAAVARRKRRIAAEVSSMIPLLRMLFEVGMTVEQALRVLVSEGNRILPELSVELRLVLSRGDAGLELGHELRDMARLLDVDELTDSISILDQLIRQGGGALASLLSLKKLLDDRRMTTLQEQVSKLSAKMSAVMVSCLFPALLIILAGPGFIAIFRALDGMAL